jgi:hypothetical protein
MKTKTSLVILVLAWTIWFGLTIASIIKDPLVYPLSVLWIIWSAVHVLIGALAIFIMVKYKSDEPFCWGDFGFYLACLAFGPMALSFAVILPNRPPCSDW